MSGWTPIGTVRAPVTEMSLGNWSGVDSEIHLDPRYAAGLAGLEDYSHVLVVFLLDQVRGFDPATQSLRKPRGKEHMRAVGVFAQRTKYRPNPIGITTVELLGVEGSTVRVRGLDALDGTPVLDIKPYIPMFDRVESPRVPPWVDVIMDGYF